MKLTQPLAITSHSLTVLKPVCWSAIPNSDSLPFLLNTNKGHKSPWNLSHLSALDRRQGLIPSSFGYNKTRAEQVKAWYLVNNLSARNKRIWCGTLRQPSLENGSFENRLSMFIIVYRFLGVSLFVPGFREEPDVVHKQYFSVCCSEVLETCLVVMMDVLPWGEASFWERTVVVSTPHFLRVGFLLVWVHVGRTGLVSFVQLFKDNLKVTAAR